MSEQTEYPTAEVVLKSGAKLRRDYLYEQRKLFLLEDDFKDSKDEEGRMNTWKDEAKVLYPNDGDYQIDKAGIVTYLGKF